MRACVRPPCMRLRACSFGLARAVEAASNVRRLSVRGANFNCCVPLPAPVLVGAAAGGGAVAGPDRRPS